ncbi:MAG: hypothetical protein RL684_858 [Pseudomonadota bacterium]
MNAEKEFHRMNRDRLYVGNPLWVTYKAEWFDEFDRKRAQFSTPLRRAGDIAFATLRLLALICLAAVIAAGTLAVVGWIMTTPADLRTVVNGILSAEPAALDRALQGVIHMWATSFAIVVAIMGALGDLVRPFPSNRQLRDEMDSWSASYWRHAAGLWVRADYPELDANVKA